MRKYKRRGSQVWTFKTDDGELLGMVGLGKDLQKLKLVHAAWQYYYIALDYRYKVIVFNQSLEAVMEIATARFQNRENQIKKS